MGKACSYEREQVAPFRIPFHTTHCLLAEVGHPSRCSE